MVLVSTKIQIFMLCRQRDFIDSQMTQFYRVTKYGIFAMIKRVYKVVGFPCRYSLTT